MESGEATEDPLIDQDGSSSSDESASESRNVQVHFKRGKRRDEAGEVVDMAVTVRVDSITSIDLQKQTFTADLWVFLLTKPNLAEDLKKRMKEELLEKFKPEMNPPQIWIAGQNLITASSSDDHPKPDFYASGDQIGLVWRICGEFGEAWELENFPFDCQDLTVSIMIRYVHEDLRMRFVQDPNRPSMIRDKTFPSLSKTWYFPKRLIVSSTDKSQGHTNRQILHVTLEVRRQSGYYVNNIVFPMLMIVIMSMSSFFILAENIGERLSASLTLVLAAVAYKYNVVTTVPPIGYHTWLDYYVLMCYVFLFLVVVENCAAVYVLRHHKAIYDAFEHRFIWSLVCLFVFFNMSFWIWAQHAKCSHSRVASKKLKKQYELPFIDDYPPLSPCRSFSCAVDSDEDG